MTTSIFVDEARVVIDHSDPERPVTIKFSEEGHSSHIYLTQAIAKSLSLELQKAVKAI